VKRTISIATLALTASTSFAFVGPINPGELNSRTYCLSTYLDDTGAISLGDCDETANNSELDRELNSQGCADGQAALHVTKRRSARVFSPHLKACLPPNIAQL